MYMHVYVHVHILGTFNFKMLKLFVLILCFTNLQTQSIITTENVEFQRNIIGNISELQNDVIFKEMTSQFGNYVSCSFKCANLDDCQGFNFQNQRCILIGNSSLPGQDVNMVELLGTVEIYEKRQFIEYGNYIP